MLPARLLQALLVATVLLAAARVAHARGPKICELEELMTPEPVSPASVEDVVPAPPPPLDLGRQCQNGVGDGAGCWPEDDAPAPGPNVPLRFEGSLLLLGTTRPPAVHPDRLPRLAASRIPVADGHQRRVDRPPRA